MEITGSITMISETQTFGEKGFRKRELVVTTQEQYPQPIMIEFVQDKCDLLDKFKEGQNVKVGINIRGRIWVNPQGEAKYFNSLQGWRIEADGAVKATPKTDQFEPAKDLNDEDFDDLPF